MRIHKRFAHQLCDGGQLGCFGAERWGTLYNCTLSGNSGSGASELHALQLHADRQLGLRRGGGGAYDGTLYNCTLTGNSARLLWRRGVFLHALQLHADRQLVVRTVTGGGAAERLVHALQLHADRQLGCRIRRRGI